MEVLKYLKAVAVGFLGIVALALLVYFGIFYNLTEKTDKVYSAAIVDFNKGNWQNSYYLFSKVSYFSPLKPMAIYHRGECAQRLDDKASAIKQYTFLFKNYPKNPLSIRARYLAAQELASVNPDKAKKYFNKIIKIAPNTDYAIASEYYLGKIILDKYSDSDGNLLSNFPNSQRIEAENHFRHYLTKAPAGKHAFNVVNDWLRLEGEISTDDYLLMARTAYAFADYNKTLELLNKTPISESWGLYVKTFNARGNQQQVAAYAKDGVKNHSTGVRAEEFQDAVYVYINSLENKLSAIDELLSFSPKAGSDYIMSLKCDMIAQANKESCYSTLYLSNEKGQFAPKALSEIFMAKVKAQDYRSAQKIGQDYLNKFPSSEFEPLVMFWLAKIAEINHQNLEASRFYNAIIMKCPDCYWAYRAYLRLNHFNSPIIATTIKPKDVEFPYRYGKKKLIENLVRLNDFDIVEYVAEGDEFVKSWVLFKRGDLAHSAIVARDAMAKLEKKPDKYDLRWRLVYPINYWETMEHYSKSVSNNIPLMMAIMREESYFDPLAQSVVGASGLMQLMPATAFEIAKSYGLESDYELFNVEDNIMLGNYYYSQLRTLLNGYDVSAVAAYNGGIGNVQNWKSSINYNNTDDFIEKIPYPETKEYVKKVFRSYWNYVRIYNTED